MKPRGEIMGDRQTERQKEGYREAGTQRAILADRPAGMQAEIQEGTQQERQRGR